MGVELGNRLLEPGTINPRGLHEDKDVIAFHQKLLQRLNPGGDSDSSLQEPFADLQLSSQEIAEALQILDRLARPGFWGWKDPRTVYFADFWLELLPKARIIVPFRHPLEVYYSFAKRANDGRVIFYPKRFSRAYVRIHERLLQIAGRLPGRCFVLYTQEAFHRADVLGQELALFFAH